MCVEGKSCHRSIANHIHWGDNHNEDITPTPRRYGVAESSLLDATLSVDVDVRG